MARFKNHLRHLHDLHGQSGFSLIEILFNLGLMTMMMLGVSNMLIDGAKESVSKRASSEFDRLIFNTHAVLRNAVPSPPGGVEPANTCKKHLIGKKARVDVSSAPHVKFGVNDGSSLLYFQGGSGSSATPLANGRVVIRESKLRLDGAISDQTSNITLIVKGEIKLTDAEDSPVVEKVVEFPIVAKLDSEDRVVECAATHTEYASCMQFLGTECSKEATLDWIATSYIHDMVNNIGEVAEGDDDGAGVPATDATRINLRNTIMIWQGIDESL